MTPTEKEISDRLAAAYSAYYKITGNQPTYGPVLTHDGSRIVRAWLWGEGPEDLVQGTGATAKEALDKLDYGISLLDKDQRDVDEILSAMNAASHKAAVDAARQYFLDHRGDWDRSVGKGPEMVEAFFDCMRIWIPGDWDTVRSHADDLADAARGYSNEVEEKANE